MLTKINIKLLLLAIGLLGINLIPVKGQIIAGQDSSRRVITTAVPFLMIAPDARSGGMGEAGGAISPDANAVHWNAAKLAFLESEIGFAISYTPWLGNIVKDMSISYLSGYYKITREQAVALSLRYFDLGDIFFTDILGNPQGDFSPREVSIDGTYSRMLTENLSIGGTARYVYSNLTGHFSSSSTGIEARPGSSFAVDLAVFYKKDLLLSGSNSNLAFGASISNIGSKLSYSSEDNKDFIPTNLRLASAFTTNLDPYNSITFALDLNKLLVPSPPIYEFDSNGTLVVDANNNPVIKDGKNPNRSLLSGVFGSFSDAPDGFSEEIKEFSVSMGVEYWYNRIFAARVGYFLEAEEKGNRKFFTIGVGFRYQVFGIDFAYLVPQEQTNPLAETLRFSLIFNFDKYVADTESVTD